MNGPAKPYAPPLKERLPMRVFRAYVRIEKWLVHYFTTAEPIFRKALLPFLLLSIVLFIRHPATNYIFDEQEALLANPYVNATKNLGYWDAIYVDFWGLPPNGSIGSYRPLPNFIWRALWGVSKHPFFHHLYNLLFHALNATLLAGFAYAATKRCAVGWLTGVIFVTTAVLTEAVSGIVGIADVLGGLGAMLALAALRLPAQWMSPAVFTALLIGLFSKESAMVCVPLLPAAALLTAPMLHPQRPSRLLRTLLALVSAGGAFVLYVELRRDWFPAPLSSALSTPLPEDASQLQQIHRALLVWFHQAPLPNDPLNNPLSGEHVDFVHRTAGALRVFWRGFTQVLWPMDLSGDYSSPQEPVPEDLFAWESVAGGLLMTVPLLIALYLLFRLWFSELRDKQRLVQPGALSQAISELMTRSPRLPSSSRSLQATFARRAGSPLLMLTRRAWHPRWLLVGVIATVGGAVGLLTEGYLVSAGAPAWVKTWPYSLAGLCFGLGALVESWQGQRRPMCAAGTWPWRYCAPALLALGMVWMVVSYFPHSNIPVALPTVRAERFWYFPVVGTSLMLAVLFAWLNEKLRGVALWNIPLGVFLPALFLGIQGSHAYAHSMDYADDLAFWKATKIASPRSAKAHLNYSVMEGARDNLETRLVESKIAMDLSPNWAMAAIYTGDTLCRMKRAPEAWPFYARGFELGPEDRSLIALALQCMHDEGILLTYADELREIADRHDGSWIRYLAHDTLANHDKHGGVDPQYRPRGYNEGPKEETSSDNSTETDASYTVDEIVETVTIDDLWNTDEPIPPSALPGLERQYAPSASTTAATKVP